MIVDIISEKFVLGCMVDGAGYLSEAATELQVSDFTQKEYEIIFKAMVEMWQNDEEVTYQTFYIKHGGLLKELGVNWSQLTDAFATDSGFKAAIAKLKGATKSRRLLALADEIKRELESGTDADDVQAKVETALLQCESGAAGRQYMSPRDMAIKCLDVVAERMDDLTRVKKCINTGYRALNKVTGGFEAGDLIILSGQTGGGKSAFAANLARDIGIVQKIPILYLNSEMSAEQIALRWAALLSSMSHTALRAGTLSDDDFIKLTVKLDAYNSGQVHTLTVPDLRIEIVLSEVRRFKVQKNIRAAIVDYIGRMDFINSKEDDWKLLTGAARRLKTLAQEQQIVIIMLAQLNASGRLAQASYMSHEADLWLNLRKPFDDELKDFTRNGEPWNVILEIVKARNARLGTIPLYFYGDRLLFTDNVQEALQYGKLAG